MANASLAQQHQLRPGNSESGEIPPHFDLYMLCNKKYGKIPSDLF